MHSQLGQDLWILEKTSNKRDGYFIDIGAYDGVFHSNTYLLEKDYGWRGICVEPSSKFNKLQSNRSCIVENLCLYNVSNISVDFLEIDYNMELCGIPKDFKDDHSRDSNNTKQLNTISLTDLCVKHNCPSTIDYLSIDTEGSELKILKEHDFDRYKFLYISIEHNRNIPYKNNIEKFLQSKGYKLDRSERFSELQNNPYKNFEDWYTL